MKKIKSNNIITISDNSLKEENSSISLESNDINKRNGILVINNDSKNVKVLNKYDFLILHRPYFAMLKSTHSLLEVDLNKKQAVDASRNELNTSDDEFERILFENKSKLGNGAYEKEYLIPIYLGIYKEQHRLFLDLKNVNNLFIYGKTGSGKSSLINNIIAIICKNVTNLQYCFIDTKGIEYYMFASYVSLFKPIPKNNCEINQVITSLYFESKKRYAINNEQINSPLIVVIDEIMNLSMDYKNMIYEMMSLAYKTNIHFIIASQNNINRELNYFCKTKIKIVDCTNQNEIELKVRNYEDVFSSTIKVHDSKTIKEYLK